MESILNALGAALEFRASCRRLAYGSQLALGALGVTLVYGILRFSNFAHGETMAFGAMMSRSSFMWQFQALGDRHRSTADGI